MNKILTLFFLIISTSGFCQIAPDVYLIQFTDKQNNPFSIDKPQEFLSERAISRRERFQIPITEQDLPVNPDYIEGVRKFAPIIQNVSKWFNSVNIHTNDLAVLDSIRSLSFVRAIKCSSNSRGSHKYQDKLSVLAFKTDNSETTIPDTSFYNYGQSAHQIGMINGHMLHNQGFQGQEMHIAVLDGGFTGVDINPTFDSLWNNEQILGSWDFVTNTPLKFDKHSHGSQVLSIMGANLPGIFIGTAPKASYYLLRTEDGNSEYLKEEDNWISGAEYADSAGADLINSSLSYTVFNDSTMDHTYEDLDGNTSRITIAADIAASKGILVVSSAGNKGASSWKYIGAPADADSILSVGAVDSAGLYAYFSSRGPTVDGRIKPNLVAQGEGTSFAGSNGNVFRGNGTSFSSPILCGLAACLWQSNRNLTNIELIQLMQNSASLSQNPNSYLGYGLPDFSTAFLQVQGIDLSTNSNNSFLRIFPNPFDNSFTFDYYSTVTEPFVAEIWDMNGRLVYQKNYDPGFGSFKRVTISGLEKLSPGIFILRVISNENVSQLRIMKQSSLH